MGAHDRDDGHTTGPAARLGGAIAHPRATLRRTGERLRRARRRWAGTLTWAIKISAPDDETASRWGDMAFAEDLADALRTAGQTVRIDRLGAPPAPATDVTLVLRGLHRIDPTPGSVNLLWVISHPDDVSDAEALQGWDAVFVASTSYRRGDEWGARPLLQASSVRRFTPAPADPALAEEVLFVGTTRGVDRPVVRDVIAAGARVGIYGHGWEDVVDPSFIRADHLAFDRVPAAYRSAGIILNDHWDDMRANGFVSNRLFDAAFAGARVISDPVAGASEIFGGLVQTYTTPDELAALLRGDGWPSDTERLTLSARIRRDHSFDARATVLIAAARTAVRLSSRRPRT